MEFGAKKIPETILEMVAVQLLEVEKAKSRAQGIVEMVSTIYKLPKGSVVRLSARFDSTSPDGRE